MLLNKQTLASIKSGDITLVFRRWKRPTVKTGGTLKTAIGVLAIEQVAEVKQKGITAEDARRAGFASRAELIGSVARRDGMLYRIEVRYQGADPRMALREKAAITTGEFEKIRARLERLDRYSRRGAWTLQVLRSIERHPKLAAGELASKSGFEKDWLKTNVRKLKNLGLTISHHPGYELSPRGRAVLKRLLRK